MESENGSQNSVPVEGIFDPQNNKAGTLLNPAHNGKTRPSDPFVPRELVRRFKLKRGHHVEGNGQADGKHPNPKVRFIEKLDGMTLEERREQLAFEQLTTIAPDEWLRLERSGSGNMTCRVMDIFCPIGKGQRGLIVAPPRTGKTTLLQDIAIGVNHNHPECKIVMLLVDERPEEVTEIKRNCPGIIFASSNDEDTRNHLAIAELAIDYAKRQTEAGADVVVLMDSLTRLSRAYNSAKGGSGRTMTGGLDIRALEKPRQLFSAARNTEEAGSLTIIASALIETGSKMDDLIFQEFKGTGNMEMVLDRKVAELRIWPAINIAASGTRREELILPEDDLKKAHFFRRALAAQKIEDAAESAVERLSKTTTNEQFFKLIDI
ncbi:transcription termination factor Rho [Puniceicoccales bacterium CK1056]|uniref:Transcription termination factor Rho n=1 Tax=Oceanipulchritudo coccoides TaxID=2706888 RepID=A0A6B2M6R0_9BACT|nr:transcription termination factor Rho [Oceanipulchritudo coccoides]NDV63495.1 transcription termination factor Rho [Oceanipulchritudo coccoides]